MSLTIQHILSIYYILFYLRNNARYSNFSDTGSRKMPLISVAPFLHPYYLVSAYIYFGDEGETCMFSLPSTLHFALPVSHFIPH